MKKKVSVKTKLWIPLLFTASLLMAQRTLSADPSDTGGQGLKEFSDRVEAYEKLHKEAEKSLPKLKKKSKEDEIAAQQQALVSKIRELRSDARRGDIFTSSASEAIARIIKTVFTGPDAHRVANTIQAGEPLEGFKVQVNQRYPDGLSFTTVPPTLLQKLPRLPDEMAYRILGSDLLLLDRKANMIVDFMPNAIP
jgi:hypothetical protein